MSNKNRTYITKSATLLPETVERIQRIAKGLQMSEAATIRVLLNEGLEQVEARMQQQGRSGTIGFLAGDNGRPSSY